MWAVMGRSWGLCWRSWAILGAYVGGLGTLSGLSRRSWAGIRLESARTRAEAGQHAKPNARTQNLSEAQSENVSVDFLSQ